MSNFPVHNFDPAINPIARALAIDPARTMIDVLDADGELYAVLFHIPAARGSDDGAPTAEGLRVMWHRNGRRDQMHARETQTITRLQVFGRFGLPADAVFK